jgi:DNA polymerase
MRAEELDGLLNYLAEVGYRDLYLGSPPAKPAPTSTGVAAAAAVAAGGTPPAATPVATPAADSDAAGRVAALAQVAHEASACTRCRLAEKRHKVVFGAGDPDADLMFIGEGPGAQEDRQGLPFVGPAGALLSKIIEAIGLTREQVYIANIVKCRPPGNRDPQPDEVAACRGFLERQVELIRPRVIVALGRVAAQTLLGNDLALGSMRGQWHGFHGVAVMVTYHPAALLRNSSYKRPTWEDMQRVRDRLRETG